MNTLIQKDKNRLRRALRLSVSFAACLWVIKFLEYIFDWNLARFGVYPHHIDGLKGVIAAPFIHGSWSHLSSNTLPVIVLTTALFYTYPRSAKIIIPVIWISSGLGVWLFGREVYHIGASGLTFGMMFFLFVIGALRWDKQAIVVSMIVFFLYGSMIWGIFPLQPGISYETHFFGGFTGTILAFMLKKYDPQPVEKKYSWEEETEETVVTNESAIDETGRKSNDVD